MYIIDILQSPQLIKRFCRDYNVPVSTFQYPYFEKQLETLSLHDTSYQKNFLEFVDEVRGFNTAEEYFNHYNEVKEKIISYITNHPQYESFSNMTFEKSSYSKKELYSVENHLKTFVSIDLSKANFTIMKHYCPDMFEGKSWERVVEGFGGSSYLQNSKYMRQVIFGACNPKKQIQAQTELMSKLASYLEAHGVEIYSVVTDEIIVTWKRHATTNELRTLIGEFCSTVFPIWSDVFKIERFKLFHTDVGFVKTTLSNTDAWEKHIFKCVDSDVYCQFVKRFYGASIEEHDLIFDYKGQLAKFITPLENPWEVYRNNTPNEIAE